MKLTEKLLRGSTLNLLDMLVKSAAVFVMMPLMKTRLGMEGWGTWLLVMSTVNWFVLLDAGATFAGTRFLAAAWGKQDVTRAASVLRLLKRFFFGVAVFTSIASLVLIAGGSLLPDVPAHTLLVAALTGVTALSIAFRFALRTGPITLRARVRYDLLAGISIVRVIAQNGLFAWILLTQRGLWWMAFAYVACDALETTLQWLAARRQHLPPDTAADPASLPALRLEMFHFSVLMVLALVGDTLRLQVSPMLVASLAGVASVPFFSVGTRLLTMIEDVVNALFGGQLLAAFTHLNEASGRAEMNRQFLRVSALAASFSVFAVAGAALYGRAFLARLLGNDIAAAHDVFLLLAPGFVFRLMQYPAHCALYSLGKQWPLIVMTLVGATIGSLLCLPFAHAWGARGVAAAFGIEMLGCYWIAQPILVARALQLRFADYFLRSLLRPALLTLLPLLILAWFMQHWLQPDYGVLAIACGGHAILYAITAPWIACTADDRHLLWTQLRKMCPR